MNLRVGSIPLRLVTETIQRYEQAFSLMKSIEILLEPILKSNNLELTFREDQLEPIWQAEKGELLRFSVNRIGSKNDESLLFLAINSDGSVILKEEEI